MEVYESEREQIEAIKKWWAQNGKAVIIGAVLGFGSLIGWQQWQAAQQSAKETASAEYSALMIDLQQSNYEDVKARGARVLSDFKDSPYAVMTALAMAKVFVEEGDFALAKTYLQMAMDQTVLPEYKHVARLRMGRLLLAEDNAQQALSLVEGVYTSGFTALYDELKGDIHVALGNTDQARTAYESAMNNAEDGVDTSELQMKLDDLGGSEANS